MPQILLQDINNNLMIMLLFQPTNNNNPNNTIDPLDPNRKPPSMNSILIRRRAAIRALQRKLPHKRLLNVRRKTSRALQHLAPHQPSRHAPSQHHVALTPHPDLIIHHGAWFRRALEHHVRFCRGACHQRNRDQSRFALLGWERKDACA